MLWVSWQQGKSYALIGWALQIALSQFMVITTEYTLLLTPSPRPPKSLTVHSHPNMCDPSMVREQKKNTFSRLYMWNTIKYIGSSGIDYNLFLFVEGLDE